MTTDEVRELAVQVRKAAVWTGDDEASAELEKAAAILRRLADDGLVKEYGSINIPSAIMLPAYRARLMGKE